MRQDEFINAMKFLVNKFGKTAFDDRKLELIYEKVKNTSIHTLREFVDDCIGEDRKPKLSDFRNLAYNSDFNFTSECPHCEGCGWDLAYFEKHNEAKRCVCMKPIKQPF